jgi:hypothetical protein
VIFSLTKSCLIQRYERLNSDGSTADIWLP